MRFTKLLRSSMLATALLTAPAVAELSIVGWVERVRLGDEGIIIPAKLDTGADTSSLHAEDIRWFARDGAEWVAFDVVGEKGRKMHFERKVLRIGRIRRLGNSVQKRPTILMEVCLGGVQRVTQVNLVDRGNMNYEMLIGRRFLEKRFLVDPAQTYTVEPHCEAGGVR